MAEEIHNADEVGRGPKMTPRQIIGLVLLGLLVIVAILNLEKVSIDLIVGSVELPLIVVIAVSGGVGFLVGWLFFRRRERRERDNND
jgi:uncharacterized integral membrane protein